MAGVLWSLHVCRVFVKVSSGCSEFIYHQKHECQIKPRVDQSTGWTGAAPHTVVKEKIYFETHCDANVKDLTSIEKSNVFFLNLRSWHPSVFLGKKTCQTNRCCPKSVVFLLLLLIDQASLAVLFRYGWGVGAVCLLIKIWLHGISKAAVKTWDGFSLIEALCHWERNGLD